MTTAFSRKLAAFTLAVAGVAASGEVIGADAPKSDAAKEFCRAGKFGGQVSANIIKPGNPMPVFVLSEPKGAGDVYTGKAIDTKVMKPGSDTFVVDFKAKTCTVKGRTYEFGT